MGPLSIWCLLCALNLPVAEAHPNEGAILRVEWKKSPLAPSETPAETAERVIKLISQHIGADPNAIRLSSRLCEDLKVDDLDRVELLMLMEYEFHISGTRPFEMSDDWESMRTVGDIVNFVATGKVPTHPRGCKYSGKPAAADTGPNKFGFKDGSYLFKAYRKLSEGGGAAAVAAAERIAERYCQQQKLKMLVVGTKTIVESDSWAEGSATFRCLDPDDKQFAQPNERLQPSAGTGDSKK
jgi:acyl carrier protein